MNRHIELIAFDLDGTVLNEEWEMSPKTTSALSAAHERGTVTVVCTGRSLITLPAWMRDIDWIDYIISSNGAIVISAATGEVFRYCPMDTSTTDAALRISSEFSESIDFLMSDSVLYDQSYCDYTDRRNNSSFFCDIDAEKLYTEAGTFVTADDIPGGILEKLVVVCENSEGRDALLAKIRESKRITAVPASDVAVEMTASGVTKGAALKNLRQMLQIGKEAAIAFGDSGNDLSMRQAVGCFVAMGNAPAEVKAYADAITLSVLQDGVARFLEDI